MAAPITVNEKDCAQLEALQKKLEAEERAREGQKPVDATAAVQKLVQTVERALPTSAHAPASPHGGTETASLLHRLTRPLHWLTEPLRHGGGHGGGEDEHERQQAMRQVHGGGHSRLQHAMHGIHLGAGAFEAGGAGGFLGHLTGNADAFGEVFKALGKGGPVIAGLGALAAAAVETAHALLEFRQTGAATGASGGQVALARVLAQTVGLGPGSVTGIAHSFRQQIATDPLAMGRFAALGIRELRPGFGTPPNEMAALLKGVEAVIRAPSLQEARKLTEVAPQLEPFLQLQGDTGALERLKQAAKEFDELASPEMTEKARALRDAQTELSHSWEALTFTVGGPLIKALAFVTTWLGHAAEGWLLLVKELAHPFSFWKEQMGGDKGEKGKTVAEQQLDEAKKQTSELQALREGTFGGGSHARSAIPAGLRGAALDAALAAHAARLGAF
jgi:hypothetical protein